MPRVRVCLTLLVSLSLVPVAASAQPGCVLGSAAGTFRAIPSTIRLFADESDVGTKRGKQGLTTPAQPNSVVSSEACDDIRREMNGEPDPDPDDGGSGGIEGGSGGIDGGGGGGGSGGLPSCATLPGGCPPPPPPEPDCCVAVCGGPPEQVPCDEDEEEI